MKQEKGVTLISLSLYVIGLVIIIGIIATISEFFYGNVHKISSAGQDVSNFSKFNMFFIEDVKQKDISIVSCVPEKIVFSNGITYTLKGTNLYRGNVIICSNVSILEFSKDKDETGEKDIVNVKIGFRANNEEVQNMRYVLRYY